jgi:hypothetical protein
MDLGIPSLHAAWLIRMEHAVLGSAVEHINAELAIPATVSAT